MFIVMEVFSNYFICDCDMVYVLPPQLRFEEAVFCEPLSIATHAVSRMSSKKRNKAAVIESRTNRARFAHSVERNFLMK